MPYFFFSLSRYDKWAVFSGAILCCKGKRVGRLDRDREYLLNRLYDDEDMRQGLVKYIFADGDDSPPASYKAWKAKYEDKGTSEQTKICMNVNSNNGSVVSNKIEFDMKKKKTSPLLVNQLANFMGKSDHYQKGETKEGETGPSDEADKKEAENLDLVIKKKGKDKEKNKKIRIREGKRIKVVNSRN